MYKKTNKILSALNVAISAEFLRLRLAPMDELNIVGAKKMGAAMYDRLEKYNANAYLSMAIAAYADAIAQAALIGEKPDAPREIDSAFVALTLSAYNLVTGYLYESEAERKRLRLVEQMLTAREYNDRQAYQDSVLGAAKAWWRQTEQYALDVTDDATITAYVDAGVKYVRWVTEKDRRTCKVCDGRDGVIYEITRIPEKTHYGCRCYLVPAKKKDGDALA